MKIEIQRRKTMLKKFTGFVIFTALVLFLAPQAQAIPNPSAVYCEEQGYELDTRTDDEGNQYGVCVFPDGSECDQWDYFCKCTEKKSVCSSSMIEEGKNCKYPCKPQPCAKAGESSLVYECCEGLTQIPPARIYDDECNQTGMTGWTHICSDCGNGTCESWESECNCPKDCKKETIEEDSKIATKSATKAAKLDSEPDQNYSYVYYAILAFLTLGLLGLLILRFRKKIICRSLGDKSKTSGIE